MPTAVEKVQARLIEMIDQGYTMFHLSIGPKWNSLTIEEKCEALLQMWDAPRRRVTAAEVDGADTGCGKGVIEPWND